MNPDKIRVPSKLLESFCQKHQIRSLDTFGSFVGDDFWPDSDTDILIDFEPGHVPGFDFFLARNRVIQAAWAKGGLTDG
jgi:predicted nucleotidyltransferase